MNKIFEINQISFRYSLTSSRYCLIDKVLFLSPFLCIQYNFCSKGYLFLLVGNNFFLLKKVLNITIFWPWLLQLICLRPIFYFWFSWFTKALGCVCFKKTHNCVFNITHCAFKILGTCSWLASGSKSFLMKNFQF